MTWYCIEQNCCQKDRWKKKLEEKKRFPTQRHAGSLLLYRCTEKGKKKREKRWDQADSF